MPPSSFLASPLVGVPLAAACGALAVAAFAPFSWYPLAVLALAALYELLMRTPGRGLLIGGAFGLGLMGLGVSWVRISLDEFGNMPAALANLLTLLFIAAMALYYAVLGRLTQGLAARATYSGPLLIFPALWVLLEWLRGWVLTGFPWLAFGYSQIDAPLAGLAPIAGVYGVSMAVALSAGLLWGTLRWTGWPRIAAPLALVALWVGAFGLGRVEWTRPAGEPFEATLIQANIPQERKWEPEQLIPILREYVRLTREAYGSEVIVWPETAVPDFLHEVRDLLIEPLAAEAREKGSEVVLGIPVLDLQTRSYYNALVSLGSREDEYRKRHLVPFGEFTPLKDLLGPLARAFEIPMSDFSSGTAERPLLHVGERVAGASICYEDAFPAEVVQALPEATYLINVSNDAWFGDSLAPRQHLEIARMRALENARWLLRATNTGISAIIDHRGRPVTTLATFQRGAIRAWVQPREGATPFVLVGNRLALVLAVLMLVAGVIATRTRSATQDVGPAMAP